MATESKTKSDSSKTQRKNRNDQTKKQTRTTRFIENQELQNRNDRRKPSQLNIGSN